MCDFKPGDEVTRISDGPFFSQHTGLPVEGPVFGQVYVVDRVFMACGEPAVTLVGFVAPWDGGYRASRFRKVQRRDLKEWLKQETSYDEEQRSPAPKAPAKRKERA